MSLLFRLPRLVAPITQINAQLHRRSATTFNSVCQPSPSRIRCQLPRLHLSASFLSTASKSAVDTSNAAKTQRLKWRVLARLAYYARIPFLVLSVYGIGYQQGIMDYSRDPTRMEIKLLDTILAGVGCISIEDRNGVLVASEGEWRNLLERFRSTHSNGDGYDDDEYTRVVMLRNVAVVGERIVKVARAHVKQKLTEAVQEATARLPPEVLENEARLYNALEADEEVDGWTKAMRHMEVSLAFSC